MFAKKFLHWSAYCAVCLSFFLTTSCSEKNSDADYSLIPVPNEMKQLDGRFNLTENTPVNITSEVDSAGKSIIKNFVKDFEVVSGYQLTVNENVNTSNQGIEFVFNNAIENSEGYTLDIKSSYVRIEAANSKGFFYGIQTLKQLMPADIYSNKPVNSVQWSVPCIAVKDAPRFAYRGMMIDVSRHFFDVAEMKKILNVMALHKLNTLHWHLTEDQGWRIEIKKYPKLTEIGSIRKKTMIRKEWDNFDTTPYGGFYTQDEIKEIVQYAADRCINVIPEIDLPGHMMAALASYPNLGCTGGPYEVSGQWGVRDDVLCPGNEATFEFIEGVLAEVMEMFPSEYIHIGGDECPKVRWEKCAKCQARIKKENIKGDDKHSKEFFLQSYTMARVEDFLNKNGRRSIGWDEILEGQLAPDATVMSWRGMDGGIEAAKMGHDVIMTPNSHLYFDHYQTLNTADEPLAIGGFSSVEKVYSLNPIPDVLTAEEAKFVKGVQANLWTEYIPTNEQLEYQLLPRLAALSEVQWTQPDKKNWERFLASLGHIISIYDVMGFNYAKHIYEIIATYDVSPDGDGSIYVTMTTAGDAPIYYTLDGSEPTEQSNLYTAPVKIDKTSTIKAFVKRDNMQTRPFSKTFTFNKATGRSIVHNTNPTLKYASKGPSILVDGLKGDFNYSTGYWVGFMAEPMDVTIDLGQLTEVSSVTIGAMVQFGEWVFPPTKLAVWTADADGNFTERCIKDIPVAEESATDGLYTYSCDFAPVQAQKVRIVAETTKVIPQWHGARGLEGHMFIDEIVID